MELDEGQIVSGLRDGCTENLELLMDLYSNKLKRTAYMIIQDEKIAEDIVQEAFIKFYYNVDNFHGRAAISTYLYKITLNECRQKLRKNWFKRVVLFDRWMTNEKDSKNIEDEKTKELTVNECISKLDIKDREIILLYYYEDLSIKEICVITGEKEGTIKSRLKRSRDKLKPYLKEAGFEDGYR